MAYQFRTNKIASFKLEDENLKSWTVANVNGQESSASVIVSGIRGLLWIAGKEDDYDYTQAFGRIRKVTKRTKTATSLDIEST
jgi:hypothetical protein